MPLLWQACAPPADTDVVSRVAVVEGYNTNTYQAQDDPNVPIIRRHPSPFTGADADLELRMHGRDTDLTTVNLDARGNHYEPLQREDQSDDGALNAALSSRLTLAPRTTLSIDDSASVTSFNAAHVTDGTFFGFDPTLVQSTYWLEDFSAALTHQLSPDWRISQSIGATVQGTLRSAPTELPSGQMLEHRGLDYVMPYEETDVTHDFTARTSGDVMLLYQYDLGLYALDLTRTPPQNIGPDKQAFLTALGGWTYRWSPELATVLRGGAVLASAPPRDVDQRPILAPAVEGELYYTRALFQLIATGGYTWGTVNPRLGAGPTASGTLQAIGVPHPRGSWKNLALIGRADAEYTSLIVGRNQSTDMGLLAVGLEIRYATSRWLGLLAGYDLRAATLDIPGTFSPPFFQNVFFIGLSGYFSNDRTVLPLTTFAAPVEPPA